MRTRGFFSGRTGQAPHQRQNSEAQLAAQINRNRERLDELAGLLASKAARSAESDDRTTITAPQPQLPSALSNAYKDMLQAFEADHDINTGEAQQLLMSTLDRLQKNLFIEANARLPPNMTHTIKSFFNLVDELLTELKKSHAHQIKKISDRAYSKYVALDDTLQMENFDIATDLFYTFHGITAQSGDKARALELEHAKCSFINIMAQPKSSSQQQDYMTDYLIKLRFLMAISVQLIHSPRTNGLTRENSASAKLAQPHLQSERYKTIPSSKRTPLRSYIGNEIDLDSQDMLSPSHRDEIRRAILRLIADNNTKQDSARYQSTKANYQHRIDQLIDFSSLLEEDGTAYRTTVQQQLTELVVVCNHHTNAGCIAKLFRFLHLSAADTNTATEIKALQQDVQHDSMAHRNRQQLRRSLIARIS